MIRASNHCLENKISHFSLLPEWRRSEHPLHARQHHCCLAGMDSPANPAETTRHQSK